MIPLSSDHVNDEGIYLLENGEDCLVYIGNSVDSNILQQLFGISSPNEIPTQVLLSDPFGLCNFCLIHGNSLCLDQN